MIFAAAEHAGGAGAAANSSDCGGRARSRTSAIGSFSLRREVLGAEALHASLTIGNFSPETHTLELVVSGDGKEVAHAREALGARETATLEFPAIPPARIYKVETRARRRARARQRRLCNGRVGQGRSRFCSSARRPADAAGLKSIPGVEVVAKNPDAYSPDEFGERRSRDFRVRHAEGLAGGEHDAGDAAAWRSCFRLGASRRPRKCKSPDGARPTR